MEEFNENGLYNLCSDMFDVKQYLRKIMKMKTQQQ